ncbi:MAG: WecB/TagA/CpsF family glycosyltransferase [Opitutales bacterium]
MSKDACRVLGISFFNGSLRSAIEQCNQGGLVVIPSGPGLATDLMRDGAYAEALNGADLVLPDSGLMALCWNVLRLERIRRISGYALLKALLEEHHVKQGASFWIMPNADQSDANCRWLSKHAGIKLDHGDVYLAPVYAGKGPLVDADLLGRLKAHQPQWIFVNIGGGVQERLGLYLREQLGRDTTIVCSGAALAFLSGQQAKIPIWADRLFLGWLFRCFADPARFVPRYWRAWKLVWLLFRYGRGSPRST